MRAEKQSERAIGSSPSALSLCFFALSSEHARSSLGPSSPFLRVRFETRAINWLETPSDVYISFMRDPSESRRRPGGQSNDSLVNIS